MITFNMVRKEELDIYTQVAKQMIDEHIGEQPGDPICGFHFGFDERKIVMTYRKRDGTETVGRNEANAFKSRHIGELVQAALLLKDHGVSV